MYGIPARSFQLILDAFSVFKEIERAGIYGSRAMGNFKNGSDVDGLEHELPIPLYFDLTHYETIQNAHLKEHIDRYAQIIYPL
jgi:uncharacterized protein